MNTMPDFAADILRPILEANANSERMAKSLAGIVAKLLSEHEPLLTAEHDGREVIVTEKGGPLVFTIAVEPGMLGSRVMKERDVG